MRCSRKLAKRALVLRQQSRDDRVTPDAYSSTLASSLIF